MLFSSLGVTFIEILKNEWLGIIASAIVLISFLTSNQIKTRIINLVGCVVFVVYGLILPAYSTAFMNAALIVVHIVYLAKDFKQRKKNNDAVAVNNEQNVSAQDDVANEVTNNASSDSNVTDVSGKDEDGVEQPIDD